ncbi:phage tail protein I [Pseudoalteromonas piscicida]|uniref:Phage tail protein I n=1 Tax=Pseudoalteromonas piscicida TaxID=43662 RepID=A0A2A5JUG9_PSEO7|nr:phage tail protein I [Pseudoalteromonas piscicida]PCK33114.1 phage tail protein I [Pseudoalteromonas piscicida]
MTKLLPHNASTLEQWLAALQTKPRTVRASLLSALQLEHRSDDALIEIARYLGLTDFSGVDLRNVIRRLSSTKLLPVIWSQDLFPRAAMEQLADSVQLTGLARDDHKARTQLRDACILNDTRLLLTSLWQPELCPEPLLPFLAWNFSVDEWDEHWSVEIKRQVVTDAFTVHQYKGTPFALQKALDSLNIETEIKEWWQAEGLPGTVQVWALINQNLDDRQQGLLTSHMLKRIRRVINAVKRGAIHIDLQLGILLQERLGASGFGKAPINLRHTHAASLGVKPEQGAAALGARGHVNHYGYQVLDAKGVGVVPDESQAILGGTAIAERLNVHIHHGQGRGVKPNQLMQGMTVTNTMQRLQYQHYQLQGAT